MSKAGMKRKTGDEATDGQVEPTQQDTLHGSEELFYIENIVDKRLRNGRVEYLIKWLNWPKSANTWEPKENLMDNAAAIEMFEASYQERRGKRMKKSAGVKVVRDGKATPALSSEKVTPSKESSRPSKPPTGNNFLDEGEWWVERILDKRFHDGKWEYLVKWQYYPDPYNSWEPEENFDGSQEAISEFETRTQLKEHQVLSEDDIQWDSDEIFIKDVVSIGVESPDEPLEHIHYVVQLNGQSALKVISSKLITKKKPQQVIKFLEGKIKWT